MKKLHLPLLLLLILSLLLCGCGEYNRPPDVNPVGPGNGGGDTPGDGGGETEEDEPFTVSLSFGGAAFISPQPISAQWSDGYSYHRAEFDEYGEASITGLDGDYQVTLTGLPTGYTYNPNIYRATNDSRHVTIELHRLGSTRRDGSDVYDNIINLQSMGVYRATLTQDGGRVDPTRHESVKKGEMIFFQFVPRNSGTYSIESWMDITADQVNPIIEVYYGSAMYKTYGYAVDTGGVEGIYTKNFRCEIDVDDDQIGMVFAFGIRVTSKTDVFPVTVDFSLQFEDAYDYVPTPSSWLLAEDLYGYISASLIEMQDTCPTFDDFWRYPVFGGSSYYDQWLAMPEDTDQERLDKLNFPTNVEQDYDSFMTYDIGALDILEITDLLNTHTYMDTFLTTLLTDRYENSGSWVGAEDVIGGQSFFLSKNYALNPATGFYHRYDAIAYADDPYGYGAGYGPILYAKISQPTRFIDLPFISIEYQGNKALTVSNGRENYKLVIEGYDYAESTSQAVYGGSCGCPTEMIGAKGYNDYANSDGAFPVTQELKDFLQKYSVNQRLFNDGNGHAELVVQPTFDAGEEDQWLFGCGYYL